VVEPASSQPSRWYCDDPTCNGDPHEGWHWCHHPIDSEEHTWECRHCRANQRPPLEFTEGEALYWMLMAGRGFGKTRSCAEWLAQEARTHRNSHWAVVAPTGDDIKDTCFEGESGLLNALELERSDPRYNATRALIRLGNGSTIRSYSAEAPKKARGPNLWGAWLEEIAQWKSREMWDNLFPAIRRGKAKVAISTTPARVELVKDFAKREDGSCVITYGTTYDNRANLSPEAVAELEIRWKGTRRERQELYGELLEDVPGALWRPEDIESSRVELID